MHKMLRLASRTAYSCCVQHGSTSWHAMQSTGCCEHVTIPLAWTSPRCFLLLLMACRVCAAVRQP
jgi:hypothetical protein